MQATQPRQPTQPMHATHPAQPTLPIPATTPAEPTIPALPATAAEPITAAEPATPAAPAPGALSPRAVARPTATLVGMPGLYAAAVSAGAAGGRRREITLETPLPAIDTP
jgi:hypothetical protein